MFFDNESLLGPAFRKAFESRIFTPRFCLGMFFKTARTSPSKIDDPLVN
jgi:hypothetical protein